jgi:small conductance mechanosensitive channel
VPYFCETLITLAMNKVEHYAQLVLDTVISFAPRVSASIFVLWIGFKLLKKLDLLLSKSLERLHISDTMRPFIISLLVPVLKIILVWIAASLLGVQLSGLFTVVAVMGFAIGFFLKGSLGNFASGILIIYLKRYVVHNWIQIGDKFGKGKEIGIFNTLLVTPKNRTLIVPYTKITDSVEINLYKKSLVRLALNVYIPYTEDFPKEHEMMTTVLANTPLIPNDTPAEIGIKNFNSHNTILAIRAYVLLDNYWEATLRPIRLLNRYFMKIT